MRNCSHVVALLLGVGLSLGCSVTDEANEATSQADSALIGVNAWAYLRCNATGWNTDDSTRLKPTADPNRFTLDFTVSQDWMVQSNDGCIITETNQLNGWGTASTAHTLTTTVLLPSTVGSLKSGYSYFFVDYAAKGNYRATVDFGAKTLLIEPAQASTVTELVETNILSNWTADSSVAATTQLSLLGPSDAVAGQAALRAVTTAGFDFWLRYGATSPIDMTLGRGYLGVSLRGLNTTPIGWQINSPTLVLEDVSGARLTVTPDSQYLSRDGITWTDVRIPLSGGVGWTTSGSANLQQVSAIEIHADTWDSGFTLDIDNVRLTGLFDACATTSSLSAQATAKATTAQLSYTAVSGAIGYNIYRGIAGAAPTFLTRVRGTSFEDSGLPLGTAVTYEVRPILAAGCESGTTKTTVTTAASNAGLLQTPTLSILIPIYKGGESPYTDTEIARIKAGIEFSRQFYYRNSRANLNLAYDFMEINAAPPSTDGPTMAYVETDLRARGIIDNQYDAVYVVAKELGGCWGGFGLLGQTAGSFGTACGVPLPINDATVDPTLAWSFTHEFQHALDLLADWSNLDLLGGHPDSLYLGLPYSGPVVDAGEHYDWEAATLRGFTGYHAFTAPHNSYLESQDSDSDGLANNDARLPMDETRFGSNQAAADSDSDGLSDVGEYAAGIFASSNPLVADTDSDGARDGVDPSPRAAIAASIGALTPTIDGVRDSGYSLFRNGIEFTQVSGFTAATYFAYDANYLYILAEESAPASLVVYVDGSGANGFWQGDDTYAISMSPNAATPLNHTKFHGTDAAGATMTGALLATRTSGTTTTLEARIPRTNLGQGFGWTAATTNGFSTTKGNALGLRIWFSQINGNGGLQEEPWATQNELFHFDDVTLN